MLFIALPPVCVNERARLGHVRADSTRVGKHERTQTDKERRSWWARACFRHTVASAARNKCARAPCRRHSKKHPAPSLTREASLEDFFFVVGWFHSCPPFPSSSPTSNVSVPGFQSPPCAPLTCVVRHPPRAISWIKRS